MNVVGIMQPSYLPWMGYLDMVDQADLFILLDTVPINKKSWQTRNRILGRDGSVVWLSVPVHAHQGQELRKVEVDQSQNWQLKHLRTLEAAYGSLGGWWPARDLPTPVLQWSLRLRYLADLTTLVIADLCGILGVETPITRASDYGLPETADPIRRVADLCEATGAEVLLNTAGARHLYPSAVLQNGTRLEWHEYEPVPYEQNGGPFIPYLSVVDALARHGPEATLDVIRAGRVSALPA